MVYLYFIHNFQVSKQNSFCLDTWKWFFHSIVSQYSLYHPLFILTNDSYNDKELVVS